MREIITREVEVTQYGHTSALYATAVSGRIIYRDKVDTIIGIKHPGIVIGTDAWGTVWVIHNHYQIGHPQIVSYEQFSIGQKVFYDTRPVFYDREEIVARAVQHWVEQKPYHWLLNNCQRFVNEVARGTTSSETVDRVSNNSMIAGGILTLLGVAFKNKAMVRDVIIIHVSNFPNNSLSTSRTTSFIVMSTS